MKKIPIFTLSLGATTMLAADYLGQYNVAWTTQSKHAGESMPVSGGDIGLNVWVENDELLLYMGRAGCRDERGRCHADS